MSPVRALLWFSFVLLIHAGFSPLSGHSQEQVSSGDFARITDETIVLPDPSHGATRGVVIDSSKVIDYKSIFVPELYHLVRNGALAVDALRRVAYTWRLDDAASARNVELDTASGPQQGQVLKRGQLYGAYQQLVNSYEGNELAKRVLWNVKSNWWSTGAIDMQFSIVHFRENQPRRVLGAKFQRIYPAAVGEPPNNKHLYREVIAIEHPAFIAGYSLLSFRFLGESEDIVWISSPINSKVRRVTGSNRADPILTLPLSLDDMLSWSGKVERVEVSTIEELVTMLPFPQMEFGSLVRQPDGCFHVDLNTSPRRFGQGAWNYQSKRFNAAADWAPSEVVFVPRNVVRLEFKSLDPYSQYGRQILYVDQASMLPAIKIVYDRSGTYYKAIFSAFGLAVTADKKRKEPYISMSLVYDSKNSAQLGMSFSKIRYCDSEQPDLQLADLSPGAMLAEQGVSPAEELDQESAELNKEQV